MSESHQIQRQYVSVNGMPTKLLTLGRGINQKPRKLVLIIPGNPGIASFYEDFMTTLKSKIGPEYSIWTIGHPGQDIVGIPEHLELPKFNQTNQHLYTLNGQIQHKIDFLREHVPEAAELTLIGHSIGCKMILEAMRANDNAGNEEPKVNIKAGYLLFPTIEWMIESPAGKRGWISVHYIPKLIVGLVWLISLLPRSFLSKLVTVWFEASESRKLAELSASCREATLDLINPVSVHNMLFLAHTELEQVLEPDYQVIKHFKGKLKFYYGSDDHWVPVSFYENLLKNVPEVDAQLCEHAHPHAFVLSASVHMAEIVSAWFD